MATRKRRSPAEAKLEILQAAESRLRKYGLSGLSIVDVAGDCGMSHATLIHHFGNTAGMRRALVERMTDRLVRDIIQTLQSKPALEPQRVLHQLFNALSRGGHAKLLAWLSVGGDTLSENLDPSDAVQALFKELVDVLARHLPGQNGREKTAQRIIILVASAAIGYGISGPVLPALIGMDSTEAEAFPDWLGEQITAAIQQGSF